MCENLISKIKIGDAIKSEKYLCESCGMEIIPVLNTTKRKHFRHKEPSKMSEWHVNWQKKFKYNEIEFEFEGKETRADAISDNKENVIEFQNSPISSRTVVERVQQYSNLHIHLYWVLNGKNVIIDDIEDENSYLIHFPDTWMCKNFIGIEYVYLDTVHGIFRIKTENIKCSLIKVSQPMNCIDFVAGLNESCLTWGEITVSQNRIVYKQRGAGTGKTYEAVSEIKKEKNNHLEEYIFLTQQHGAKTVIADEVRAQLNISLENDRNKYTGEYESKKITIATVDSFIYSLLNRIEPCSNYFKTLAEKVSQGHTERLCETSGNVSHFANGVRISKKTMIVIDESQDLSEVYASAFMHLAYKTHVNITLIGDKLQSLNLTYNIMNKKEDVPSYAINCEFETPTENICRRFHNPSLMKFVNEMVPFEKFGLPHITGICNGNNCGHCHDNIEPKILEFHDSRNCIIELVECMTELVYEEGYLPEDFVFIFPVLKCNTFATELHIALQEFWKSKFNEDKFLSIIQNHSFWGECNKTRNAPNREYIETHSSEGNGPINLTTSEHKTRIQSIHSSKGTGRKCSVTFLSEILLTKFRTEQGDLKYESLLHVSLTRCKEILILILGNSYDDIYRRIPAKNDIENNTQKFPDLNKIRMSDIFDKYDKECNFSELYEEGGRNRGIIDWSDHCIRNAILHTRLAIALLKEDTTKEDENTKHLVTIFGKIKKSRIRKCKNSYEYYSEKKTNASVILTYEYIGPEIYNRFEEIICKVQDKLNKNSYEFDPLESIVLYFLIRNEQIGKGNTDIPLFKVQQIISEFQAKNKREHDDVIKDHYQYVADIDDFIKDMIREISCKF